MIRRSRCSRGSLTVYSRMTTVTPCRLRQLAARQGSAREAWENLACRVVSRIFISERQHIAAITTLSVGFQRVWQYGITNGIDIDLLGLHGQRQADECVGEDE